MTGGAASRRESTGTEWRSGCLRSARGDGRGSVPDGGRPDLSPAQPHPFSDEHYAAGYPRCMTKIRATPT